MGTSTGNNNINYGKDLHTTSALSVILSVILYVAGGGAALEIG